MISIALAIVVNLLTIAVVIGFQKEVREKVSGFSSHAFIMSSGEGSIYECEPIRKNQAFIESLRKNDQIVSLNNVAFKPMLLQSAKNDFMVEMSNGKDSSIVQQDIQGAILKGVDKNYDWSFVKDHMLTGKIPVFSDKNLSDEIVISQTIANHLKFKVGDSVRTYFVKNQPLKRFFRVAGIYKTGLEEFDKKMVFGDIRNVQLLNDWGLLAEIEVMDTLSDGYLIIKANVQGGNGYYEYDWGKGYNKSIGLKICPTHDTIFRLIARDVNVFDKKNSIPLALPDTAYLEIRISGDRRAPCDFKLNNESYLQKKYKDTEGLNFDLIASDKRINFQIRNGKGSAEQYIGGMEVRFRDWDLIDEDVRNLKRELTFIPTEHGEELNVSGIKENQQEIFVWLDFLDLNVYIILILMILIGIVNVGAALLVMILVKTQFIGLMKAMGAINWQIRKIFLVHAFFIIGKGMVWGNIIGLGICFIQSQFGILQLNPEVYYLSKVPIEIGLLEIIILNAATLLICLAAMIIPSAFISRIVPTKAIKFQ
jgi:lipoprotein-releasing system permease protein